jgi:hypothetical protein
MQTNNKCIRDSCYYEKHTNINNNGGIYCCRACRDSSTHGPACQHSLISPNYFINKIVLLIQEESVNGRKHYRIRDDLGSNK